MHSAPRQKDLFLFNDNIFFIFHPRDFQLHYTLPHSVIQCKVNNEIQFRRGKMMKTQAVKNVN